MSKWSNDTVIKAEQKEANDSFDNDVFLDIEVMRTGSIFWKFILKQSEHGFV
jgi:hypothetical protein